MMNAWKLGVFALACLLAACGTAADDKASSDGTSNTSSNANTDGGDASCSAACENTAQSCPAALGGMDVGSCAAACEGAWTAADRNCLAGAGSCQDVAACDSGGQNTGPQNNMTSNNEPTNNTSNEPGEPCSPFVDTENEGCPAECDAPSSIFIDGNDLCTARCSGDDDCAGGSECNLEYNGGTCLYRCEGTGLSCPEGFLENTTTQCGNSGWCGI